MTLSKINTIITLEYLRKAPEDLYFDRKRAKISLQGLANEIASFANANGGVIAVGVADDGKLEGFNSCGTNKLNDCQKVSSVYLNPSPIFKNELVSIKKDKGEADNILLIHVQPAYDFIVRNNKDEVYLRQGDSSIKLNSSQIKSLEYDKRERNFETEIIPSRGIEDVDTEMMQIYKSKIGAEHLSDEEVLKARGFLVPHDGKYCLNNAGLLLFGKNPTNLFPCARVRVLKFEGTEFQVGRNMNIVKDRTFDKCLYKIIEEVSDFIRSQLREFTYLHDDGIFRTIPEYPEFPWFEGLVNAIVHRDYTYKGDYIRVSLYDDRLEIFNPGGLGGFVTVVTMTSSRYSRNPMISRVLTELGVVRELNEGVSRMIDEMRAFFLKDPIYIANEHSVKLVLDNNIVMRSKRKTDTMLKNPNVNEKWKELNLQEQKVLKAIYDKGEITAAEVEKIIERSRPTAVKLINKLIKMDLVVWTGTDKFDTHGRYIMK